MESVNCPKGLDADYGRKVCRNCGRSIHFTRATRGRRAHWQHDSDRAGLRWYAQQRRLYG